MCVAVIFYGVAAVFVDAIIVGVALIDVGVFKIFVDVVIVPVNCNNIHKYFKYTCLNRRNT